MLTVIRSSDGDFVENFININEPQQSEDHLGRRSKDAHNRADNKSRNTTTNHKDTAADNHRAARGPRPAPLLLPKNLAQEAYIDALENPLIDIVFATGPAGTGKTMLAALAAIKQLQSGTIEKIVITRPAVSVDEQHGFLPGTLIEKMQPWVLPILDYFYEVFTRKEVVNLIEMGIIDVSPLAYMRGRTLKHSFVLADECQNMLPSQMKMLLTRIGTGSKIVVTGDMAQHDRGFDQNGLKDILLRMTANPRIAVCRFEDQDVERHPIIASILRYYDDERTADRSPRAK